MLGIEDIAHRMWVNLEARPGGRFGLRFLLQPAMAIAFAIRDGLKDARTGRSPYFLTVLTNPAKRGERLREGLAATGKILVLAFLIDAVYQFIELGAFYPGEAIIVAIVLGFIPYFLIRGPAERIARWWRGRGGTGAPPQG